MCYWLELPVPVCYLIMEIKLLQSRKTDNMRFFIFIVTCNLKYSVSTNTHEHTLSTEEPATGSYWFTPNRFASVSGRTVTMTFRFRKQSYF